MIRVADYIMKRIIQEDVNQLFYVPGGQCVYLTDALRRAEQLQGIAVHHEQAAAMAALSYGLYTNHLGACLVTTGCAGTNTMTGVLHAWQDSIPCIFISGQQNYNQTIQSSGLPLRQVGMQETDIVKLVTPITKYAAMITDPNSIVEHMEKAIHLATSGRKGPVWIDVPLDVQNSMIDELKFQQEEFKCEEEILDVEKSDLQYVIDALKMAKRPVLLMGQGVRYAGAEGSLRQFADENGIPIVFTRFSIDLLPYNHKNNFGILGSVAANRYANFIVQNADLLISVGSRLSSDTTGSERSQFAREAKIIVVDIDKVEHAKDGVKIDKLILSDANIFMSALVSCGETFEKKEWLDKCNYWKKIFPNYDSPTSDNGKIDLKYALEKLSFYFPENTTVISDAGMTGAAVPANCRFKDGDRSLHSFAQGEMGYSLPGAIGAASISKGMVFAISGDGSFMMNLQELQTVVRNQFNIKIIINNNNGYSGVRHGQKAHFRGKSIGTDGSNGVDFPDYGKIAEAFGIAYCKIETVEEFEEQMKKVVAMDNPYICEIMCDPEQFDLHNALVMYGKRKFGFRPIEDQSPFIDRDVFFGEMIVEPLETSYGKPM